MERILESSPLLKFPCFSAKLSTPPSHLSDESKAITQADVVMPDTVIASEQEHNQDLGRMYSMECEFSIAPLSTRMYSI